jgi:plasmid stability protein
MTITIDIRPEVQAELARQAAAHGSAVEAYAAALLEEAVQAPAALSAAKNLIELSEPVRGLLADDEIDRLFSRNPATARPGAVVLPGRDAVDARSSCRYGNTSR